MWNLTFIFSVFHEKFSLVLLQMIYYILSHWKTRFFVHWKLKSLNFLADSVLNYQYAYVEIHFHPWFILFKKEKTFILKPRKTCNKTLSFQELVARTAAGGLFAVCRVLFSFVVCKVRDVSQTPQMKPPASLRRLKNLLITNFVLFH